MRELLDRFCRYVRVETTAVEQTDRYPSSPGQLELGRMLRDELLALGLKDATQDENGIVMATIPATAPGAPTIAWLAHLDTSPEYTARNVKPVVRENYDGRDIQLEGDRSKVIRVADAPQLEKMKGKTLITTDGTTLLGADDKAGVAVIMTAAAALMRSPGRPRGPIRIVFTCDEEVGRGTNKLDLKKIGAVCGYTLDGEGEGLIENETFSADGATVTCTGVNIHPGLATGRMINAIRGAGAFVSRLPADLSPERTADRAGFIHPYVIEGGVSEARIRLILRSFETRELENYAATLRQIASAVERELPGVKVAVDVQAQYRNMREYLDREPRAVGLAAQALKNLGRTPEFKSIRGGTDGSRLSEMGLPTPNLSTGMHNFHSPLEFACLEEMQAAVDGLVELAALWSRET
jgi:tripeptide aminopeptidase